MKRLPAAAALGAVVGIGLVSAVLVILADARAAQRHLTAVQADARLLVTSVKAGRPAPASVLSRLTRDADAARSSSRGIIWRAVEHVPVLGRSPRAIATLADAAATVSHDVLPLLTGLTTTDASRPDVGAGHVGAGHVGAGRVDLDALDSVTARVTAAARSVRTAAGRVDRVNTTALIPAVRHRFLAGRRLLDDLDRQLAAAGQLAGVAGDLVGASGERRYLVVLQNTAEARGTGGLPGAYLVLAADRGRIRVVRSGTDDDLERARAPVASLGPDYAALYGEDPALWSNANLSPQFPDAARLWLADWRQVFGDRIDGVLATDPTALGRLLAVSGPFRMRPSGVVVRGDTVVALTERDLYARFPHDNDARKRFLLALLRQAADHMLHMPSSKGGRTAIAAARAAAAGRFLVYSEHPDEERAVVAAGWGGVLPRGPRPFLRLTVDNAGGNKLDYYLRRELTYQLGTCAGGVRPSVVTATLTNAAPDSPLPRYVASREDVHGRGAPRASNRLLVYLHLTAGAGLQSAELDGRRIAVHVGAEQGHPVVAVGVELPRGQKRTLVLHLQEPAMPRADPLVQVQPLVQPQQTRVTAASCRGR